MRWIYKYDYLLMLQDEEDTRAPACRVLPAHAQVENGKNAMPAWADRLDADEIANVAAYVYNQADTNGW